ncbi:hypothetical protein [Mucilaginibacter sp.]|uniref:hypothetical protein n=1 Tax=Mucilaginibacter sp. TaxID=1882438 RepID=UPI002848783C|nr:hypothetical protein [Mucilaginibacter sp.]MDR3695852.1 hypothetical protein [Mucilaginibacter sp.]
MNIDDLKGAWKNDNPKDDNQTTRSIFFEKSLSPVTRIRRNMKTEFIAVLISYTMFTALMFYGLQSVVFFNLASIFMFIIIVLNSFYYFRFYIFYKSISRYDLNIKNSISKITYELELNAEIYKTYNFCVTPLAVLITFILLCGNRGIGFMQYLLASNVFTSPWNLPIAFAVILISFIITYVCINHHVRTQYGRYINELKQIMEDLGDEG